ncbi:hypothetical protein N8644_00185 [bacterium]|nr:hypothetical protein [bacterium]
MKFLKVNLNENINCHLMIFGWFVLLAILLDPTSLVAQQNEFTTEPQGEVQAWVRNQNAKPSGLVKGTFEGREQTFEKFRGIHELLSVPASVREKGQVAPLGGRIRGGVKNGFKSDQPAVSFINETFSTNSPHINATAFENRSVFEAVSIVGEPYYFYNTKYFTNSGKFRVYDTFDYRTYETYENLLGEIDYDPVQAEVFDNQQGGILESAAPSIVSGGLRVEAAVIKNQGLITAPSAGLLQFKGESVDLTRGAIEIKATPSFNHYGENQSLYWGWWGGYQGRRAYRIGALEGVHLSHYGMPESYWGVTPTAAVNGLPGFAYPLDGAAEAFTSDTVIELATKYAILSHLNDFSYSAPYGGYWSWVISVGGEQFTPYVWEYRYLIGTEYHHTIQVVCLRSDHDGVEFDARLDPLVVNRSGDWNPEQFYGGGMAVDFRTARGLTNVITGGEDIQSFSLIDQLPNVETAENFGLTNLFSVPLSEQEMPDNFVLSRYTTAEYEMGINPNSALDGFTFNYSTQIPVTYHQSALGFRITNILSRLNANVINTSYTKTLAGTNYNLEPVMSAQMLVDITNGRSDLPVPEVEGANALDQPGRVKISAKNLDLTDARIRAEGAVWLEANHLMGSSNAIIDCQNLNLRLGSTNGLLVITNIAKPFVERFGGFVEANSLAWQNQYPLQIWNGTDLEDQTVNSHYSFLIVDGHFSLTNEVLVNEMVLTSEKVVLEDTLKVVNKLRFPITEELEINNLLRLGAGATTGQYNWNKEVAPKLRSLVINGLLDVPEVQKFGNDRIVPYELWSNYGTNKAYNTYVHAQTFQNSGRMTTAELMNIKAKNATFEWSHIETGESFKLKAENAKFRNQTNIVYGLLSMDVAGMLTDGGPGANSYFEAWEGVNLLRKPQKGDLLGSSVLAVATNYTSRVIHWPGEDRGASTAGYTDNAALGQLTITNGVLSKFTFEGEKGRNNAIYVDYLEFKNLTEGDLFEKDVQRQQIDTLVIPEGYTVYFASANLPEELLDGMYEGRLRWVKEFPGTHSSMPFYVTGVNKTIQVNRPFRQSILHDTDGDGTANGYDLTPFGNGLPNIIESGLVQKGLGRLTFSWLGVPDSVYHIEYKDDLGEGKWKLLKKFHYDGLSVKQVTHEVPVVGVSRHRFYRVVFVE